MRLIRCAAILGAALAGSFATGCSSSSSLPIAAAPAAAQTATPQTRSMRNALSADSVVGNDAAADARSLCTAPRDPKRASCLGAVRVAASVANAGRPIGGLRPSDLAALYDYAPPGYQWSTSQVVGIVVAGNYPSAASDLAVYRAQFGLPACTVASGCLRFVGAAAPSDSTSQSGSPSSVSANPTGGDDPGWASETDSDMEAVSAVCPNCKIVVAEAASDKLVDLGNAVSAAVAAGATIVNASFGAPEDPSQRRYESLFEPPNVKVVAAAGDGGPAVLFPAAATNVVSVAGTTVHTFGFFAYETLWANSGGGCSRNFARPSWQYSATCGGRSVADIAAVGDPATGLAFYDSALGGWGISGGTSISAPIITAMWALSGDTGSLQGGQRLYQHPFNFIDVLLGGTLAGLGVPNGLDGF